MIIPIEWPFLEGFDEPCAMLWTEADYLFRVSSAEGRLGHHSPETQNFAASYLHTTHTYRVASPENNSAQLKILAEDCKRHMTVGPC